MKIFKYGIELFDSRLKKYGGFNHFLAGQIFRWRLCYLMISLEKQWKFERIQNSDEHYYDGYHNTLAIGFVLIYYGT